MKTYYVIRIGWNAANQSAMGRPRNPKNSFESGRLNLVWIGEANSIAGALQAAENDGVTCYNNQSLSAETHPKAICGLTAEIRSFVGVGA